MHPYPDLLLPSSREEELKDPTRIDLTHDPMMLKRINS